MRACGVPNDSILREPLSKNTGAYALTLFLRVHIQI
jgi:hypothetical protein